MATVFGGRFLREGRGHSCSLNPPNRSGTLGVSVSISPFNSYYQIAFLILVIGLPGFGNVITRLW